MSPAVRCACWRGMESSAGPMRCRRAGAGVGSLAWLPPQSLTCKEQRRRCNAGVARAGRGRGPVGRRTAEARPPTGASIGQCTLGHSEARLDQEARCEWRGRQHAVMPPPHPTPMHTPHGWDMAAATAREEGCTAPRSDAGLSPGKKVASGAAGAQADGLQPARPARVLQAARRGARCKAGGRSVVHAKGQVDTPDGPD